MALLDSQDENAERVGRTIAERNDDHKGRTALALALRSRPSRIMTGRPRRRLGAGAPSHCWPSFVTVVNRTIVNVARPTIGRKLHSPGSDLQWS